MTANTDLLGHLQGYPGLLERGIGELALTHSCFQSRKLWFVPLRCKFKHRPVVFRVLLYFWDLGEYFFLRGIIAFATSLLLSPRCLISTWGSQCHHTGYTHRGVSSAGAVTTMGAGSNDDDSNFYITIVSPNLLVKFFLIVFMGHKE